MACKAKGVREVVVSCKEALALSHGDSYLGAVNSHGTAEDGQMMGIAIAIGMSSEWHDHES